MDLEVAGFEPRLLAQLLGLIAILLTHPYCRVVHPNPLNKYQDPAFQVNSDPGF